MKPYEMLTERGKIRRLRQVALKALEAYELPIARVRFLGQETNTLFRVDCHDGAKYALRICAEGESTLSDNEAEIFWLTAIHRDTDIKAIKPIPRHDGDYITIVTVDGVPWPKRCILYSWIPGVTLSERLTPTNYEKLGRMAAELHQYAATLNPLPEEIKPLQWDKVFYYGDEPIVYNTEAYQHLFPSERIALMEEVMALANPALAQLHSDTSERMLIHGDLHYWNVHVSRGNLYVLDFDDIMLGYPVQDVAITLYYGRFQPNYPPLKEAFIKGYSAVRPWPSDDWALIELLMIARTTSFMNYAAHALADPEEFLATRADDLRQFLAQYG